MHRIFLIKFPMNTISLLQEKGRCGRYEETGCFNDVYQVFSILFDIEYVLAKIIELEDNISSKLKDSIVDEFYALLPID